MAMTMMMAVISTVIVIPMVRTLALATMTKSYGNVLPVSLPHPRIVINGITRVAGNWPESKTEYKVEKSKESH